LPVKSRKEANPDETQIKLLRMILAELQALNANLATNRLAASAIAENVMTDDTESDNEELENFE